MEEPNQNQKLRTKEIKGVIFLALAVFLLLCLFSYFPQDPSFTHAVPPDGPATHNLTGKVGSYTADSLIRLLGFASFLIPLALLAGAFNFFLNPSFNLDKSRLGGFFFFTLSLSGLLGALIRGGVTFYGEKLKAGGHVGTGIVQFLLGYFNPAGTYIILILIFIVSLFFIIEFSLVTVSESFSSLVSSLFKKVKDRLPAFPTGVFSRMKIKISSPPVTQTQDSAPKKAKPRKIEQTHFDFSKLKSDGKFQLPPLTLLDTPPRKDGRVKRDQLITNSRILEKKTGRFRCGGPRSGSHARSCDNHV